MRIRIAVALVLRAHLSALVSWALVAAQDKTHCKQMNLVPVYEKGLLLFRDFVVRAPNISGRFKHIMLDNVRRSVSPALSTARWPLPRLYAHLPRCLVLSRLFCAESARVSRLIPSSSATAV